MLIKKVSLFIFGFLVLYVVLSLSLPYSFIVGLKPGRYGYTYQRFQEVEKVGKVDVLCLGSSHAYRSFDPRLFLERGLTMFNLGTTSQQPLNSYYLLKAYLPKLDPALVILEVVPGNFNSDGLESFIDLSANMPFSKEYIQMGLETRNIKALTILLSRCLKEQFGGVLEGVTQDLVPHDTYINGGYIENLTNARNTNYVSYPLVIQRCQLDALERIVNLVHEDYQKKLLLVIHPLPETTLRQLPSYYDVIAPIKQLAEVHQVPFMDFNLMGYKLDSMVDFKDDHHLNARGVHQFNKWLLTYMEREKLFK